MNKFYKVAIIKLPMGSATEHREPPIQGRIIIKVDDLATQGSFKLFVVDCDKDQHKMNSVLPGVLSISEEEANRLAPLYQPERTVTRPVLRSQEMGTVRQPGNNPRGAPLEEKVTLPALDLRKFY